MLTRPVSCECGRRVVIGQWSQLLVVDAHIVALSTQGNRLQNKVHFSSIANALNGQYHYLTIATISGCNNPLVISIWSGYLIPCAFSLFSICKVENVVHTSTIDAWAAKNRAIGQLLGFRFVSTTGYGGDINATEHAPCAAKVVRVKHIVLFGVIYILKQHRAVKAVVVAHLSSGTLENAARADEHRLSCANGTLVELRVNAFRNVGRSRPCLSVIFAIETSDSLVILTSGIRVHHIARATH